MRDLTLIYLHYPWQFPECHGPPDTLHIMGTRKRTIYYFLNALEMDNFIFE